MPNMKPINSHQAMLKSFINEPSVVWFLITVTACILTSCSQSSTEEAETQPLDQNQANETPVANRELSETDTETETAALIEVQFHREQSFGSTDDVLIGEMGPIAVGLGGEVFLSDSDQATIHVFQSDGSYIKSLGRQGRGPGEFMMIYGYTTMATHGNRLYVTDLAGMTNMFPYRMHLFSLDDLSFIKTIDLIAENRSNYAELSGHYSKNIYPLNDSRFLVSYHRSPNEYQEEDSFIQHVIQDSVANILSGPFLKQKDRKQLSTEVKSVYRGRINDYIAITQFPFFGKSILEVSGDDTIYAVNHTEEFRIDVYSVKGESIRAIEHEFDNVPFIKNEVIDRFEQTDYKPELGDGVAVKIVEEAEQLPSHWPAIQQLLIDSSNRLWVSTIVEDFDVYEWWLLEPSGERITKFDWPRDEPIEVIKNGKMYTRKTDEETGLEQVVRYNVEINGFK